MDARQELYERLEAARLDWLNCCPADACIECAPNPRLKFNDVGFLLS